MGVGPMNLVITNDALYQLSYTSAASDIIATRCKKCKLFFQENEVFQKKGGRSFLCPPLKLNTLLPRRWP